MTCHWTSYWPHWICGLKKGNPACIIYKSGWRNLTEPRITTLTHETLFYAELWKTNPATLRFLHSPKIPILCSTQSTTASTECYTVLLQILTKMPDNDLEDLHSWNSSCFNFGRARTPSCAKKETSQNFLHRQKQIPLTNFSMGYTITRQTAAKAIP